MPSGMTAEAFCEKHGRAIVRWLRDNTTECDCDSALKFGADEKLAHKKEDKKVDADTVILCRRCFVPVGLHNVCLRTAQPHARGTRARPRPPRPCVPSAFPVRRVP